MQDPAPSGDVTATVTAFPPDPAPRLAALAAGDPALPPYDFAEFERRAAARRPRGGFSQPRVAGIAASLTGVLLATVLWQRVDGPPTVSVRPADGAMPAGPTVPAGLDATIEPAASTRAVVRVREATLRAELADHIALLDALLSEAQATGEGGEPLQQMQQRRDALADSLQRVAWADALTAP